MRYTEATEEIKQGFEIVIPQVLRLTTFLSLVQHFQRWATSVSDMAVCMWEGTDGGTGRGQEDGMLKPATCC